MLDNITIAMSSDRGSVKHLHTLHGTLGWAFLPILAVSHTIAKVLR